MCKEHTEQRNMFSITHNIKCKGIENIFENNIIKRVSIPDNSTIHSVETPSTFPREVPFFEVDFELIDVRTSIDKENFRLQN